MRDYLRYIVLGLVMTLAPMQASFAKPMVCSKVTYPAPSGSKNDITFSFDKSYECGKFANGDWWVSAGLNASVTITSVTPAADAGRNGQELNPSFNRKQAFDHRVYGFDQTLLAKMPLSVKGDASLVKAVSIAEGSCRNTCLQFAAVLTVLAEPIPEAKSGQFFRVGYFGSTKQLIPLGELTTAVSAVKGFASVPVSCCLDSSTLTFDKIARRYQGVQLDHFLGWVGRAMHPIDNMPDYGSAIAVDTAAAVLRMALNDFDVANPGHRSALINYLQLGVDLYAMAANGVRWPADGGHGSGRKLPLLFAGTLLKNTAMLTAVQNIMFAEDEHVYKSTVNGKALFGRKCVDSGYWQQMRFGTGAKDCRDPYGYIDGGNSPGEGYDMCCNAMPWTYSTLAVRLFGLQTAWGSPVLFEYVDRWNKSGAVTAPDVCAPYDGVPDNYKKTYGPNVDGTCIRGAGRWPDKNGINAGKGYYGNKFANQLWGYTLQKPVGVMSP